MTGGTLAGYRAGWYLSTTPVLGAWVGASVQEFLGRSMDSLSNAQTN